MKKLQELLGTIFFLREKAELNKLVIFVGAGVSCNVEGMPSWNELIVEMSKAIGYKKCNHCKHKQECNNKCSNCTDRNHCTQQCLAVNDYSSDDYLRIPQYVYNKSQKKYTEIIKHCISDKMVDAPISKAIFELNPAHIITTNYDKLLESSSSEYRNQYDVVITDRDLLNSSKSKYIIKMHGDVLYPNTIVLKEQDYLNYSQEHVLIELFVKALLADHTILFLGYSLNDYNIKLIISWINYLRSKNGLLSKNKQIGFIVLDEEKPNTDTINYFRKNGIGVLNISSLPEIKSLPSELVNSRGRRIYSFLKIIKNPSLEYGISSEMSIDSSVDFIKKHRIHDYTVLLKLLNISNYNKQGSCLDIREKDQYLRLESYFKTDTDRAEYLKQIFVNVGLSTIQYCYHNRNIQETQTLRYSIDTVIPNTLLADQFYDLYIQNKYSDLLELCKKESSNKLKSYFYKHFVIGFLESDADFAEVEFSELNTDNKISYLHNYAFIKAKPFFGIHFDSKRVLQFINNIPSQRERQLYNNYIELYNGNPSKRLDMTTSLERLKQNIASIPTTIFEGGAVSEIYKIKNIAIMEYLFYYTNNIFTLGSIDARLFFRPFIEAIIIANKDAVERSSKALGIESENEKYHVAAIDFDIITKYISVNDLENLIKENNILAFKTDKSVISHLVACFVNMSSSIVSSKAFGFNDSSIIVLANLALLLTKIELNYEQRIQLSKAFINLFSDNEFNDRLWSIGGVGHHGGIGALSQLIKVLPLEESDNSCVHSIINSPSFFDFAFTSNVSAIRCILLFFLKENQAAQYQAEIIETIDSELDFTKKVMLLRLFYKRILNKPDQKRFKDFLSKNFTKIGVQAIYDFALSGWIEPSDKDINDFEIKTLELYHSKTRGVDLFPDPVKTNLECIYILHIFGFAKNLKSIEELSAENPHLHFLLSPETFDFSLVDFSDYMWVNFARQPKLMDIFINHRDKIIPKIKDRIKKRLSTEDEKRILYGFLLNGEEVWKE